MNLVVGQFNDSFEPIMDGVANVTYNYAHWLNKKGVESHVITPLFPGYDDNCDFQIIRYLSLNIPMRAPYRLGMPYLDLPAIRRIKQIPFNIVHAHCPFSAGQVALNVARKRDIPIVATFHSKYYDDFKEVLKSRHITELAVKRIIDFYNKVDHVWTVNRSTTETLRSYGYKGTIDVVYNGTDFVPPDNIDKAGDEANRRLNLDPNEIVFLFVGQLIWQKNLELTVKALHHLKQMGVSFKMILAGGGYAEGDLKKMVEDLNLSSNVEFLGVIRDRELLKSLFARADLFLFPSLYDTSGIVIQEAAALKCPSLVIENSNVSEGIKDCYNGFLVQNDALEYAKKIRTIISNRELLHKAGTEAQRTLYRNWDQVVEEVRERYVDIVKTYETKAV